MKEFDIIGYTLDMAIPLIEGQGLEVGDIRATLPPKHRNVEIDNSFRVVRVDFLDNKKISLLVCKTPLK